MLNCLGTTTPETTTTTTTPSPIRTNFTLIEGNETVIQENSYQNATGVLGRAIKTLGPIP